MSRNFELLNRLNRALETPDSKPLAIFADNTVLVDHAVEEAVLAEGPSHRPRVEGRLLPEMERMIQKVFLLPNGMAPRVVMFAGVGDETAGDGICPRVADLLSSRTKSLCVVDANLLSPSIHSYFGLDNHIGLAEALRGAGSIQTFAQKIPGSSITILTTGSEIRDPLTLLASEAMSSRLLELRKQFHYVLVQVPPLSGNPQTLLLGKLADGVVMILEAHSTRREAACRAKQDLDAAKVHLLGAVLNNLTFPIPDALYARL